jgi:hypothetical protein
MKKFIYTTIAFMLMFIFVGCYATMTSEQRRETYDLRTSVGNSTFVGDAYTDSRGLMIPLPY